MYMRQLQHVCRCMYMRKAASHLQLQPIATVQRRPPLRVLLAEGELPGQVRRHVRVAARPLAVLQHLTVLAALPVQPSNQLFMLHSEASP